jgi:hypothetical protein
VKVTLTEIDSTIERGNRWIRYRDERGSWGSRYTVLDGERPRGALFLVVHGERSFEPQFPTIQPVVLHLPPREHMLGEIVSFCPEKPCAVVAP